MIEPTWIYRILALIWLVLFIIVSVSVLGDKDERERPGSRRDEVRGLVVITLWMACFGAVVAFILSGRVV